MHLQVNHGPLDLEQMLLFVLLNHDQSQMTNQVVLNLEWEILVTLTWKNIRFRSGFKPRCIEHMESIIMEQDIFFFSHFDKIVPFNMKNNFLERHNIKLYNVLQCSIVAKCDCDWLSIIFMWITFHLKWCLNSTIISFYLFINFFDVKMMTKIPHFFVISYLNSYKYQLIRFKDIYHLPIIDPLMKFNCCCVTLSSILLPRVQYWSLANYTSISLATFFYGLQVILD